MKIYHCQVTSVNHLTKYQKEHENTSCKPILLFGVNCILVTTMEGGWWPKSDKSLDGVDDGT